MLYELKDSKKGQEIFEGWQETMIYSCLQKVMGHVYVTDFKNPKSAVAIVGCFAFYAGTPNRELVQKKPEGFAIMVPQNEEWEKLIEKCFPSAKRVTRYAIKKNTRFNKVALQRNIKELPVGYELARKSLGTEIFGTVIVPSGFLVISNFQFIAADIEVRDMPVSLLSCRIERTEWCNTFKYLFLVIRSKR